MREMGWRRCNTNATPDGRSGRRVGDTTHDAAAALLEDFDQKLSVMPVTKPVPSFIMSSVGSPSFIVTAEVVSSTEKIELFHATPGASV